MIPSSNYRVPTLYFLESTWNDLKSGPRRGGKEGEKRGNRNRRSKGRRDIFFPTPNTGRNGFSGTGDGGRAPIPLLGGAGGSRAHDGNCIVQY